MIFTGLQGTVTGLAWSRGPETPWLFWESSFMPAPITEKMPPGVRSASLRPVYWKYRMPVRNPLERTFCDCGVSQNTSVKVWRISPTPKGGL